AFRQLQRPVGKPIEHRSLVSMRVNLHALSHCDPASIVPVEHTPSDSHLSAPIDLARVRSLFGDPSRTVESQFLRREVAQRMHERLALIKIEPRHALDAGCGEGADLAALQKRFPQAEVIGLDASTAMLRQAQSAQKEGLSA